MTIMFMAVSLAIKIHRQKDRQTEKCTNRQTVSVNTEIDKKEKPIGVEIQWNLNYQIKKFEKCAMKCLKWLLKKLYDKIFIKLYIFTTNYIFYFC